jgi:hypothetical protein
MLAMPITTLLGVILSASAESVVCGGWRGTASGDARYEQVLLCPPIPDLPQGLGVRTEGPFRKTRARDRDPRTGKLTGRERANLNGLIALIAMSLATMALGRGP